MLGNERSIRDLLIVVLRNISKLTDFGLCWFLFDLEAKAKLSRKERRRVEDYLDDNLSYHAKKIGYAWPPGDIEPREKWLNEQINKL